MSVTSSPASLVSDQATGVDVEESVPRRKSWIALWAAAGSVLLLVATVGVGWMWLGGPNGVMAAAQGRTLLVENGTERSFGPMRLGATERVTYRIKNLSLTPIDLLGCQHSCCCQVEAEFPVRLHPGRTWELVMTIKPTQPHEHLRVGLEVFTISQNQSVLYLAAQGKVLAR
jgi:hypothetical protein